MMVSARAKTWLLLLLMVCSGYSSLAVPEVTILDESHYSHVFAETRHYRIFLPPGYTSQPDKKYPVIYFLHGWSQRYFGSGEDRYAEFDKGNDNGGENFENYVATHDVIIVKSDGYNRSKDESYYLRPYNIGPVETFRQFPIYFPELISHIDLNFRTVPDRKSRAITGLSMGGFMSFVIGGKYPHLFSGVGNFCGSPEFFIGPKDMPVEYRHLDMHKNYSTSKVRLHYGDKDFIRAYHEDLNRVWPAVQENYSFRIYPGEHSTTGMNDMLDFLMDAMKKPLPKTTRWDHIDFYPSFEVWNYKIITDRNRPGFTMMENVGKNGFKIGVKSWLPDGEWQPYVKIKIITDAIYEKNTSYLIHDYSIIRNSFHSSKVISDGEGRLKIEADGGPHIISILEKKAEAVVNISNARVVSQPWIIAGVEQSLRVELVNSGNLLSRNLRVSISSPSADVHFKNSVISVPVIASQTKINADQMFQFTVNNDSMDVIRLNFKIHDGKSEWIESVVVPLRKQVPALEGFVIADGKSFTVYKSGTDFETVRIGEGNGDGKADAGELIEVLVKDKEYFRRTLLYSSGSYEFSDFGSLRESDYWGNYDNVGGSAKFTPVLIPASSAGNKIRFFAEYWYPEKPVHHIRQGVVEIDVKNTDQTGPLISWVTVSGNNRIQARILDGSPINRVRVKGFQGRNEVFNVELNDRGLSGDEMAGDSVFTFLITAEEFGIYRLLIEAADALGNVSMQEMKEPYIFHR